jgi:ribosomal protein S18 acetylase RimI-like enzyme
MIREALPEDLDVLFAICRKAYSENFAHHWNEGGLEWYLEKVYSRDVIQTDLTDAAIRYFIAYDNTMPVGFMKLKLHAALPGHSSDKGLEVDKIYFLPAYQGKGIGKSLINQALQVARDLHKDLVWLGVIDTNLPAIEFYRKIGFEFHDKTRLEIPFFKEDLKGMWRMKLLLK